MYKKGDFANDDGGYAAGYRLLFGEFLSGTMPAEEFQKTYLRIFKNERYLDEPLFELLDELFGDVDSFTTDQQLLTYDSHFYLDEVRLREKVQLAVDLLATLPIPALRTCTTSMTSNNSVWIFVAENAPFPSGVFDTAETGEAWVTKHNLSGTLTEYIVGTGVFEWAVAEGAFMPKPGRIIDARFVGRFTSAAMRHRHYEDGRLSS